MSVTRNYLALDLGAESGRGLLGHFDGQCLALDRKSTRLNSSHLARSRMPSSA